MLIDKALLSWFAELSTHGVIVTDAGLNVYGWNHWVEAHSGRAAAEVMRRNLIDVYPEIADRGIDEFYRNALEGQVIVLSQRLHEYLIPLPAPISKDASARMQQSVRIAPVLEKGQVVGTITIIEDVTERVEYEKGLEQLVATAQEARRQAEASNRAKDEFLAILSHELRSPLNAISGWVGILRRDQLDPRTLAQGLEIVERNTAGLAKLVEDLLDVSRIVTGRLSIDARAVEMSAIINTALESVKPAAEAKGIDLKVDLDPWVGLISGDPARLEQVIWNLLSNAIKFTPKGGGVEVRLEREDSDVVVTVSDTGVGISREFQPYVFDRFRQADASNTRRHQGLGLGLAIVRHLVELHGGSVKVDSEGEGRGARFTIRLPLIAAQLGRGDFDGLQQSDGDEARALLVSLAGLSVLVVDDDSDARELMRVVLGSFGAEIVLARSVRQALEILTGPSGGQWVDVLVSDIGMPEEDGYDLIRKVRSMDSAREGMLPAIALSGYARLDERDRALAQGYQAYLVKPVRSAELIAVVADLVGRLNRHGAES
jgi:PAS domain S-box-containing protein